MIYKSVEELIGNTPLLELTKIEKKLGLKSRILAKLEMFNPASSAKDRVAREIILQAEKSGKLKEGGTIIEATSGNTGIALAMIGASRGYRVVIVMPDSMSRERVLAISAYGAEVIFMGDFNTRTGLAAYDALLDNCPLVDAEGESRTDWSVDHIFVSKNIKVNSCKRETGKSQNYASDHSPVICDFDF